MLRGMRLRAYSTLSLALLCATAALHAGEADNRRLADSATMFKEIMDTSDRSIPRDLLKSSECAVLIPGMKKAGFILGAKYGYQLLWVLTLSIVALVLFQDLGARVGIATGQVMRRDGWTVVLTDISADGLARAAAHWSAS